jgi:MFS superfamily sulfate permease-like transporter
VDLVGLALANIAAGCSSTFVVNGSPTKTAIVDTGGGRSQVSHLTTAATVLLVLLFLTKPLSYLPNVVLAAIVFLIGVKLIDRRGLTDLYQKAPGEFALAVVTAATVVLVGVEQGILLAMVLSLLQHVRRSYKPHMAVILRDDVDHWRMEQPVPGKMLEPGLVMFWFGADLFYANAASFTAKARQLVEESPSPLRWLVIDAGAITGMDFSGASALAELQQDLAKNSVVLALARLNPIAGGNTEERLKRLGVIKSIGPDRIFSSRSACLEAYRAQSRT